MSGSTSAPFGFRPVSHLNGHPWNGGTKTFVVEDANLAIYIGDPVAHISAADTKHISGRYMSCDLVTVATDVTSAGHQAFGVMMSRAGSHAAADTSGRPKHDSSDPVYIAANTDTAFLNAVIDPFVIFIAETDVAMTYAAAGKNAAWANGTGSTVTGLSGCQIDGSTIAADASLQLFVFNLWDVPLNEPDDTYSIWEVMHNTHWLLSGNATLYDGAVLGI